MDKRITIVFKDDDQLYQQLIKYVDDNFTTISGVVKLAIQKLLNEKDNK